MVGYGKLCVLNVPYMSIRYESPEIGLPSLFYIMMCWIEFRVLPIRSFAADTLPKVEVGSLYAFVYLHVLS